MIKLKIDTSSREKSKIELNLDKEIIKKETTQDRKSQSLLPLIFNTLKENNLEFKDINEVEVNIGPGSFTGLRVGVSVAQAISYALDIPLNGEKLDINKPLALIYS